MLIDLFPLLCQSVDWFEYLVGDWRVMSEVRSSELEIRLPFSDNTVEEDTEASTLRVVRAFFTLEEECGLDIETHSRFREVSIP